MGEGGTVRLLGSGLDGWLVLLELGGVLLKAHAPEDHMIDPRQLTFNTH